MTLLYQTHSPFARKALVFAHEVGLADQLNVVHHETSPTVRNDVVFTENPLGKVPVLLRQGLAPIFDSDVICAYLDTLHEREPLIPAASERRWQALQVQAVAQGIAEAGIAVRWETVRRPETLRYPALAEGYEAKLVASYDWLEVSLDTGADLHVGHIGLATALAWLQFRDLPSFRSGRPRLSEWFDAFAQRPSMLATPLFGDTHDIRIQVPETRRDRANFPSR
ncbi:glutathione S-transferase family protein [Sphingomonas gei]|uniref:Glutathione S-transferase family protein n=2 Tax=Sphingomonas gei TaxID=1395960 RepID=A0A4S1XAH8_9SPHN|nr:glutathione S-transferase family protein [Sphingomonas gei]